MSILSMSNAKNSEVGQTGLLLGDCHGVVSRASP